CITCQPVRDVSEIVAKVNKLSGLKCRVRRAKAIDLGVDAIGGIGGAISKYGVDRTFPILAFEAAVTRTNRSADGEASGHNNHWSRRVEHGRPGSSDGGASDAQMEIGAAMHAGIRIARVI